MDSEVFDYIVVGGGSAGCAAAARLAEDKGVSVLLLEAGPKDRNIWIHIPIGYGKTMFDPRVNWQFESEPEPHLNNRKIYQPRGRVLGGSSSINGLVYIRGQREDFDSWEEQGNEGWGWDDMLPLFKRSEGNERGADEYHGGDGPLKVSNIRGKHELVEAFIKGAGEQGIPRNDDVNGPTQEGAGYFQLTTHRRFRCSTARGYVRDLPRQGRLVVETEAMAQQVLFEGKRAIAVRYKQKDTVRVARARLEIVLSTGAFQSPQLLQCSGIGPAELLRKSGVPVIADSPEVGANLQDHLQVRMMYRCTLPITTNDSLRTVWGRGRIGLQWLLQQKGPVAAGIQLGCMFAKAGKEADRPDVQFHFGTISADLTAGKPHDFPGFTISVCCLRPTSRGRVWLKGPEMIHAPSILFNYLETEYDRQTMIAGVKLAEQIIASKAMQPYVDSYYRPERPFGSDNEILEFLREKSTTIFHPVGTCRMGSDGNSVVDPQLRVRGVSGLRVADASIMPAILSGNTNAGSIIIGERAADLLKESRKALNEPQFVKA